jgi:hypothetical protein
MACSIRISIRIRVEIRRFLKAQACFRAADPARLPQSICIARCDDYFHESSHRAAGSGRDGGSDVESELHYVAFTRPVAAY